MPRSYEAITLKDVQCMLSAAEVKAASLGIAYNIAVVDTGGHLVAFVRQDGSLIGSIDLAIDKAVTARHFRVHSLDPDDKRHSPSQAKMLSDTLHMHISAANRSANWIGASTRDLSRVAYIVTDDESLGQEASAVIESQGTRAYWLKSASEFLACKRPEVASCLLISLRLSDMSGLDLQRMLGAVAPPIVFLSDDGDIPSCVRAIKEGAHDFLTLPFSSSHLLEVMEEAFRRDQATLALRREDEDLKNRWRSLTSREAEVMRYVVAGFLNKQTAYELRITENTVQVHRGRVMRKMRADSFASLVRMSLRLADHGEYGLLDTPVERHYKHPSAFVSNGLRIAG